MYFQSQQEYERKRIIAWTSFSSQSQQFSVEQGSQWRHRHIDSLLDSTTQRQKEIKPEGNKYTKTKRCHWHYGPAYSTAYFMLNSHFWGIFSQNPITTQF